MVARRKGLGLTQQALADLLGLHKQFVSRVELGERRLDVVEFTDIARALGMIPGTMVDQLAER
jgi:transcriptional regulator with XRE-family HTH domain